MSHYRTYGKAGAIVAGFTVKPETQTIITHPKDQLPFTYKELTDMNLKRHVISGHTSVWYDPKSTDAEWTLSFVPAKGQPMSRIKFRGTAYITGKTSASPPDTTVIFHDCGFSEEVICRRIKFHTPNENSRNEDQ